jgi:hypothetical protein
MSSLSQRLQDSFSTSLFYLGFWSLGLGFLILLYDLMMWLKTADQKVFTVVMDVLRRLDPKVQWTWVWFPTDWLGLHSLLEKCPLFVFVMLLCPLFIWIGAGIASDGDG